MPTTDKHWIRIDTETQILALCAGANTLERWPVSTARNGLGEINGSGCTPRGEHRVRIKIGQGCEPGTVFIGRRPTGERYSRELAQQEPGRDWILSRILWLTGSEGGANRGGECDTLRRFIYIHGAPDTEPMGIPLSHGCIRMRNPDIITLFDQVETGCRVLIDSPRMST